jgi:hypothetical protein
MEKGTKLTCILINNGTDIEYAAAKLDLLLGGEELQLDQV